MAKISYTDQAVADLERISHFLLTRNSDALGTLNLIDEAIGILGRHPFVGRPAETTLHELVISQGKSGHLALYNYDTFHDIIQILSIEQQREAGFRT